ncbi:MAG: InlB B-repeat-containing protein [Clostridia bacterium]|nr:InlB B-repeat-containing protein [Clostridia bacterium]
MRKFKALLAFLLILSILPFNGGLFAPSALAETSLTTGSVVNYFNSLVGISWGSGKCLNFVRTSWQNLGAAMSSSCCAYNYGSSHIASTDINSIPVGADVFFGNCGGGPCGTCGASYYGHVGVYVGGGYFVHATGGKVQKTPVSNWASKFRGWGYHGGVRIVNDDSELRDGNNGSATGTITDRSSNRISFSLDKLETIGKTLHLYGWAYDTQNPSAQVTIHVYPGEGVKGYTTTGHRTDVNSAFNIDGLHGFDIYCETSLVGSASISIDALYTDNTGAENIIKGTVNYHNEYTVSYNANGGSGAPASQKKIDGTTLKLSTTVPSRAGYIFSGWATSKTGAVAYQPGNGYSKNNAVTLYAQWVANTYNVDYNANGGSGAPEYQTKTHGTDLTLSTTVPTRSGYTFKGWATSSDSTTVVYSPGSKYTENEDLQLFAVWAQRTYSVVYNANGGSGAPASQTKTHGVQLKLSETIPYRSGYRFMRWATSSDTSQGVIDDYGPGDIYSKDMDLYLYAVWSINTYEVTYDANGGSGAPASQSKNYGASLTLSDAVPTRGGYTFMGWATSSTATKAEYQPGDTYTADADLNLYAIWQAITYTVAYDANGGSGAPASQIKSYGASLTLSSTVPTRDGYAFLGWATSDAATAAEYQPGDSYVKNASLELYAVWQALTYTVTYDAHGGSGAPASQVKRYNEDLTLSSEIPVKDGWIFLGWRITTNKASYDYRPGDIYTENADLKLYAFWMKDSYRITYDANGGSDAPASQIKYTDESFTLSSAVPTRNGFAFLGWATSSTATAAEYQPGDSYTGNRALALYAVWKQQNIAVTSITLSQRSLDIKEREQVQLTATVAPIDATNPSVTWSSSDDSIATVDINGLVTGVGAGSCAIIVKDTSGSISAFCFVNVEENPLLTVKLPEALTEIESEAFFGDSSIGIVVMGEKVTKISSGAFRNCVNLTEVWIPASVKTIATNAFDGCDKLTIHCVAESIAWYYAKAHDIPCSADY